MSQTTTARQTLKRHKWSIDLTTRGSNNDQYKALLAASQTGCDVTNNPPGYTDRQLPEGLSHQSDNSLVDKRSWDIAVGPLKQLPMNMFLMYMSGNIIGIFPIMMVGMMFFKPVQAILGFRGTCKMLEGSSHALVQKFVYLLGNALGLGLALYKCQSMGLLPTHASDWLAFVDPQTQVEFSGGGFSF